MELFNETPVDSWGWLQLGFNDIHESNIPKGVSGIDFLNLKVS